MKFGLFVEILTLVTSGRKILAEVLLSCGFHVNFFLQSKWFKGLLTYMRSTLKRANLMKNRICILRTTYAS